MWFNEKYGISVIDKFFKVNKVFDLEDNVA